MEQVTILKQGSEGPSVDNDEFIQASSSPHSGLAKSAFVCGIIAVSMNLLAITAAIGFFVGIIAIVFGAMNFRHSTYARSGLLLGLLSMFVILVYVLSAVVIKVADPFI